MARRFQRCAFVGWVSSGCFAVAWGCESHPRAEPDAADIACACDAPYDAAVDAPRSGERDASDPMCRDQDARGEGPCDAILGYAWRSGACGPISGCSCAGTDCGATYADAATCLEAHRACERVCGGISGVDACLAGELCDYPDGSFCGGDDSLGRCVSRPTDCPEPGGLAVCGCDGRIYSSACEAHRQGIDVRSEGRCPDPMAYEVARADRDCAPHDGPAWRITLTTERTSCDIEPPGGFLTISVWHALEDEAPGRAYRIAADGRADGAAQFCPVRGGPPCLVLEGTFSFREFRPGERAQFAFDLRSADGRRVSSADVVIDRWWCNLTAPGCG